jgi:hypothetical protein
MAKNQQTRPRKNLPRPCPLSIPFSRVKFKDLRIFGGFGQKDLRIFGGFGQKDLRNLDDSIIFVLKIR